jgi:nitrite reductase (NADH) small subunit/3-phenylpropionate/trans-cinnamate dioxygenase ferredoxin subunit
VTVACVGAIPEGGGESFVVRGRMIAVFCYQGIYHAIDDLCPHMGASLATGELEGGIVSCPWHAWRFRISDGTWCDNPRIKIDSFPVRLVGDEIQVAVSPRPQPPLDAPSAGDEN